MKFGKHIQRRQLDLPEYAASFVDYKALKKLIKKLSSTPVIAAQSSDGDAADASNGTPATDPQQALLANRNIFFFHLDRELEKVNKFYLQKEAELNLRLRTLIDRKKTLQSRTLLDSKSSRYITLEEGFRQFSSDLNKLQQSVEINATAFSKILKKWDKTAKSRTKELYLSRAVEVQPCFNREIISDLSDKATASLLELAAWAEGEKIDFPVTAAADRDGVAAPTSHETEVDAQIFQAVISADLPLLQEWLGRIRHTASARERISRAFLSTISDAPNASLTALLESGLVDLKYADEINERTCLHEAAIHGREVVIQYAIGHGANVKSTDVYERNPLHYAAMHGHDHILENLVTAAPETAKARDLDNFTPLIQAIIRSRLACVEFLLELQASIDPASENDHIPLNLGCQYSSPAIVDMLLAKNPSLLPDAEGLFPQHLVARAGRSPQLLLMLRNHGANLNEADKLYQWTPLFHAASEGHVDCLQTLLQCGVNAELLDEKGLSAMYYATWEGHLQCMKLLATIVRGSGLTRPSPLAPATQAIAPPSHTPPPLSKDASEGIPDLTLPPPIIPIRRYGHNFLDSKTFVIIALEDAGGDAVQFYNESKYPAARLTVSSKASDLIPRNLHFPVQDDVRVISFQIDNLDTFSLEFDIYPIFGSKMLARAAASSKVFTSERSSSGHTCLELFDPRLRPIGRISFDYHVVTPFPGIPLQVTHFATYWRATTQFESRPDTLITGSSLSGEYVRLFVQVTSDLVPVLYPGWKVTHHGLQIPINQLSYEQFTVVTGQQGGGSGPVSGLLSASASPTNLPQLYHLLSRSSLSLYETLHLLPPHIHLEIHILFPTRVQEDLYRLGPTPNINRVVDAILTCVFEHARHLRGQSESLARALVLSSYNSDICTALNWKQPNYPVLLCHDIGVEASMLVPPPVVKPQTSGRATISIKEAVRIAQHNNLMGLVCSSQLLQLVPAIIESIKVAGLVLVSDASDYGGHTGERHFARLSLQGVDGVLRPGGVLKFNESIDL